MVATSSAEAVVVDMVAEIVRVATAVAVAMLAAAMCQRICLAASVPMTTSNQTSILT